MTASSTILQTEIDVFEQIRLSLLERAPGKYALVKGRDLIDTFSSETAAIREGYRRFGNEPFLVKHIVEADIPLNFTSFNLGM
jgi:hypothetical protein